MTKGGTDYDSNNQEHLYKVQSYINFIRNMANSEYAAEYAFLTTQLAQLKENHEDELAKELELCFQGGNNDPQQYLLTINKLFQDSKTFEENVKNAFARIKSISRGMNHLDKDAQQALTDLFDRSYEEYKQELLKKFKESSKASKNKGFQKISRVNEILATRINKVIQNISKNTSFIEELTVLYNTSGKISNEEFKRIVINTIVQTVINERDNASIKDLEEHVQQILKNMSSDLIKQNIKIDDLNAFNNDSKKLEAIEIAAFNQNHSIANIITDPNLSGESLKDIKKRYKASAKLIDEVLKLSSDSEVDKDKLRGKKAQLTNELRSIIKQQAEKKIGALANNITKQNYLSKLDQAGLITPISLSDSLSAQLSNISINADALAEVVTSEEARTKLIGVITSSTPGKTIQLKSDVRFAIGYLDSNATLTDGTNIQNIINDTIDTFYNDFMSDYKAEGKGSTSVSAAITAYKQTLFNMKNHIDQIVQDQNLPDESRQQLYQAMYETFSNSVSVKDYDLYNNQLGVHGGNLGAGSRPESVINNITQMYQLGGITAIDAEKILFAVLNCGNAMVGSNIREHLETYLLGGAALMMFDDGFANSENFLAQMAQEFEGFIGQRVVHFYRVGPAYIPASYILDNIVRNLEYVYKDLENQTDFSSIQSSNKVTIINDVTESIIPDAKSVPQPIDRWTQVSQKTQSSVQITFSFMAGLLDIIENFAKAINIK